MRDLVFFLFFNIIIFASAVSMGFKTIKKERLRKLLIGTPLSNTGFLKSGLVRICGKVSTKDRTLVAPVSQKACVSYRLVVDNPHNKDDQPIIDDRQCVPFFLDDHSGRMTVDMTGAETCFENDLKLKTSDSKKHKISDELRATLLEKYKLTVSTFVGDITLHFEETILEPGDTITVLGTAHLGSDGNLIHRGQDGLLLIADGNFETTIKALQKRKNWVYDIKVGKKGFSL
ncbi:MAG TPA: GIDE domain-containing protein [bacterium]|nr:GIDE domain-containing protein [bacterium]